MERITGECVAVDAMLPLRTRVGELRVERGEAGGLRGGGGGICLDGVFGLGMSVIIALGKGDNGDRFRGLWKSMIFDLSTFGGADRTVYVEASVSSIAITTSWVSSGIFTIS